MDKIQHGNWQFMKMNIPPVHVLCSIDMNNKCQMFTFIFCLTLLLNTFNFYNPKTIKLLAL